MIMTIISKTSEINIIQIISNLKKAFITVHSFIFAKRLATFQLIGTKNNENNNPTESEIEEWIAPKLAVKSATVLPIMYMGIPTHIKKVKTNNGITIITIIKFFFRTSR